MTASTIQLSSQSFCPSVSDSRPSELELGLGLGLELEVPGLAAIRNQFPILKSNPGKVFFDNAATAQKPITVLETIEEFNREICANAGRGAYSWSTRLSREVENTRKYVGRFLNSTTDSIAFTSGATESLNLVATMWGLENLADGDEVMLCESDHASSVFPWYNIQRLLRKRGISISIIPFKLHHTGTYDRKSFQEALSPRTRIVILSHIHHLYGMEMDIAELKLLIPKDVFISLDASQSVSHITVDSKQLDVDFISFSGHKMFAANGIGVLWASSRARLQMNPIKVGAKTKLVPSPEFDVEKKTLTNLVECGTLNLPSILSLKSAIEFIEQNDINLMSGYISGLTVHLVNKLKYLDGIEFAPGIGVCYCTKGFGIVSFKFAEVDSSDVGAYLDSEEIFVKTGDQCLGSGPNSNEYIRVSLQVYNSVEEIDRFVEVLKDAIYS